MSKESQPKPFGNDILLIINYHFPYYQSMDLLKKMYGHYFPNIVFYGPKSRPNVNVVDHYRGWFSYKDIGMAMQKYPGYAGYFWINDDLIINPERFERFDKTKLWMCKADRLPELAPDAITDWGCWQSEVGFNTIKKVYEQMPPTPATIIRQNLGENRVGQGFADIAYIPAQYVHECIKMCALCAKNKVFLEIALPTICLSIIPIDQIEFIEGKALWGSEERGLACNLLNKSIDYVHPIKLSSQENRRFIKYYFNITK
jgi:hypothetical protein